MNATIDGSIKIALIEKGTCDTEWISALMRSAGVPADVVRVARLEDVADAEVVLLAVSRLGPLERDLLTSLHAEFPQIPLVVLSGAESPVWAGEAVRLGAQHVLITSRLTSAKLASTIRYYTCYVFERRRAVTLFCPRFAAAAPVQSAQLA